MRLSWSKGYELVGQRDMKVPISDEARMELHSNKGEFCLNASRRAKRLMLRSKNGKVWDASKAIVEES